LNYLQSLASRSETEAIADGNGQRVYEDGMVPMKNTFILTTHLKNFQLDIFPTKFTNYGADRVHALNGFLGISIR